MSVIAFMVCLLFGLARLGEFANPPEPEFPAFRHAIAMLGEDQAHGLVRELQARPGAFGGELVLDMIDRGVRHRGGADDFKKRRRLDHLHVAPEMAGVVAQIAEPAPAHASCLKVNGLPSGIWLSGPSWSSIAWKTISIGALIISSLRISIV